jgi:hypothetical protein
MSKLWEIAKNNDLVIDTDEGCCIMLVSEEGVSYRLYEGEENPRSWRDFKNTLNQFMKGN